MKPRITLFFLFTYMLSWTLWLPTVLHAQWRQMPSFLLLIGLFADFMPSILGLILLKQELGTNFKVHLKERFSLAFNKIWLLVMLVFPIQAALSLALVLVFDPTYRVLNPIPPALAPLVFLQILFVGGALGEELGWRGYALPRLQDKIGPLKATLLLGFIWSLWHLPLFFMVGTVQSSMPLWQFLLQNTLVAFFYTWIYNKTRGNLILMILLHAVMNTSAAMFPYWQSDLGRYIGFATLGILLLATHLIDKKGPK